MAERETDDLLTMHPLHTAPSGTQYVGFEDRKESMDREMAVTARDYLGLLSRDKSMPKTIYRQAAPLDEWPGEYEGTAAYFDEEIAWIKEEAEKLKWWPQEKTEEVPKRDPDAWRQAEGVIELDEPAEAIIRRWRDDETKD